MLSRSTTKNSNEYKIKYNVLDSLDDLTKQNAL